MGTVTLSSRSGATITISPDTEIEIDGVVAGQVSDGYHTFEELYAHRNALFLALMSTHLGRGWWSRKHDDGSSFAGFVIAGMDIPGYGQVTYHFGENEIPLLNKIAKELEFAPKWDGHTSDKVLQRLTDYAVGR